MADRTAKITQSVANKAKPGDARYRIRDTEIAGFWLVVYPSGKAVYRYRYRAGGGRGGTLREPKIGEHPAMKAEAARRIAADWAAVVRQGGDPSGERQEQRNAPTMAEAFERYLDEHGPYKKPASLKNDRRLIGTRLVPALGRKKVRDVKRDDVQKLHRSLAETPYEANRVLALLSKIFNLAELWEWRPEGSNPCRKVARYKEERRERYLTADELERLGSALRRAEAGELGPVNPYAIAAIRLLVFTGARSGEILGLRWEWIDEASGCARLPDSKSGKKMLHLPPPALEVLRALPRAEGNPHVIVGGKPGAHLVNLKDPWAMIREAAGLGNLRIHDLRHAFATLGASRGLSLYLLGGLLGHSQPSTTARYAHYQADPLRDAAADISGALAEAMGEVGESADVVHLRRGGD